MRRVTGDAAVRLDRGVLVNKRPLLVGVALDAGGVRAGSESRLFELKTAVRIVTIAALHRTFQHLVMERQIELVFGLTMATETKLRLALLQQLQIRDAWLLRVGSGDEDIRSGQLSSAWLRVSGVAVGTTDVIAPVLTATEVVVFLSAGVAA